MKKFTVMMLLMILMVCVFSGCKKKEEPVEDYDLDILFWSTSLILCLKTGKLRSERLVLPIL